MEIADKLCALRKAKGLTQEETASALFVTRQSVYKWETGKALPDLEKLRLICLLFGISADELLGLAQNGDPSETQPGDSAESIPRLPQDDPVAAESPKQAARHGRLLPTLCLSLLLFGGLLWGLLPRLTAPGEIRAARAEGMIPPGWVSLGAKEIRERDFLGLLNRAAALRLGAECPALQSALSAATNERLTREKAAYWLYCAHIWTVVDPAAALRFEGDVTEVSARDQWQDMNAPGRAFVDSLAPPWEWRLCGELAEAGALFDRYDGSNAMDAEINAILDGRCYSSVAFCLAQRSFASDLPLMETQDGRFRPKDSLTAKDAVLAVRRLYESW